MNKRFNFLMTFLFMFLFFNINIDAQEAGYSSMSSIKSSNQAQSNLSLMNYTNPEIANYYPKIEIGFGVGVFALYSTLDNALKQYNEVGGVDELIRRFNELSANPDPEDLEEMKEIVNNLNKFGRVASHLSTVIMQALENIRYTFFMRLGYRVAKAFSIGGEVSLYLNSFNAFSSTANLGSTGFYLIGFSPRFYAKLDTYRNIFTISMYTGPQMNFIRGRDATKFTFNKWDIGLRSTLGFFMLDAQMSADFEKKYFGDFTLGVGLDLTVL